MTSHHYTETATPDATKRYPSDLNDWEFDLIAPHVAQKAGSGKKRTVDIREVLNAIFYRIRTGCQWRMLPTDKGLVSSLRGATVATVPVVCDNRRSNFADSLVIQIRVIF